MRVTGTVVVVMGTMAALACRAAVDPDPFRTGQVFVLQSIAGVALPAPEAMNNACGSLVVADTLVLHDDGTGLRRTVQSVPSYDGPVNPDTCEPAASAPRERITVDNDFEYALNGTAIEVNYPCDDVSIVPADCIPGPHHSGTLSAQGLTFDVSNTGRAPLVYVARPD